MKILKSYKIATALTALPVAGGILTYPAITMPLLCLLFAPFIIRNDAWRQYAYFASVSVFFFIAASVYFTSISVLLSVESLSDFEGPNGEGSPIAPLIGILIWTIWFIIPWTITALRSFKLFNSKRSNKTLHPTAGKLPV